MFVATDANAMGFIHLNVHPQIVVNLYLIFSLVSICFQLASSQVVGHF
jgi:hypothetical protein